MKLKAILCASSVALACGCSAGEPEASFGPFDSTVVDKQQPRPLEELIAQTFVLTKFEGLMVASGLLSDTDDPPYTMLMPWDPAFERLPPYWTKMTRDRRWVAHLRDIAENHVHQGLADGSSTTTMAMLNGDEVELDAEGARPVIDGIRVLGETAATDGYAYILREVRQPPWTQRTVADIVAMDSRFAALSRSLTSQDREALATTDGLTLFAPTNRALCENGDGAECTNARDIAIGDYLVGRVIPKAFTDDSVFEAQSGSELRWNVDTEGGAHSVTCVLDEAAAFPPVDLSAAHELAVNGVVFPIDALLCSVAEDTEFTCDIACGASEVRSRTCAPSMTTTDEAECAAEREACCLDESDPCPTFCGVGYDFAPDSELRGQSCSDILAGLSVGDRDCSRPAADIQYACCENAVPPPASSPCLDFCGADAQLVGSRLTPDGSNTCWDYTLSVSSTDSMCTAPDPAVQAACCGAIVEPEDNRYGLCCLCGDCRSGARSTHAVGPDGLTCGGLDFDMLDHEAGSAMCDAAQAAFQQTCCDADYEPPPPVPGQYVEVPPCARPNAPAYCDGPYPTCDLCRDGSYPKSPYTITAVAYIPGNPNCADLYWMGREGSLPEALCYPIQGFMQQPCGCE